jgi:DNA-binding SARP family transcriptional activator
LQLRLQNMWTAYQQKRKNRPMAPQLLKHALKEKDPQKALKALQQAFLTQIQEGRAPNPTLQQFLESIDAGLYGQNKDFLLEDMKKKAHVLFQEP